jgi:hypothetical protein
METINYNETTYEVLRGKFSIILQRLKGKGKSMMFDKPTFKKDYEVFIGELPRPKKAKGELSQLTYNGKNEGARMTRERCKRLQSQLEGTQNYKLGEFDIV